MKSISVIIPNYNNDRFIEQCILSVVNQTYKPYEIIVVDDCSTDNSRQIIERLCSEFSLIRPIFLPENHGVSYARNIGINAATSDYVTTLDGDDYYFSDNKLFNEMKIINDSSDKTIITYSKIQLVDIGSNLLITKEKNKRKYLENRITVKLLCGLYDAYIMRDYCFPKALFTNGCKYDENISLFEDFDFLIQLSFCSKFYFTNSDGTAYRIKNFGLSQKPKEVLISSKNAIRNRYIKKMSFWQRFSYMFLRLFFCVKQLIKTLIRRKELH